MPLRRLRLITAPRRKTSAGPADEPMARSADGGAILARWLAAADRAHQDATGRQHWQVYSSPIYAELWYAARDAGERLRARAVSHLYAHRAQPGGRYPDPREPATFSARAILTTAARLEGLTTMTYPLSPAEEAEEAQAAAEEAEHQEPPLAWLASYPPAKDGHANSPQLWLHPPTDRIPQARTLFAMACLLGYITKEPRLLDPHAPHGVTLLPDEPGLVALMHQFAFALLHLDPACPADWGCHCNIIRGRYTAPPADHDQPTETLTLADLASETRATDPHH